jgi:hypothetical protein
MRKDCIYYYSLSPLSVLVGLIFFYYMSSSASHTPLMRLVPPSPSPSPQAAKAQQQKPVESVVVLRLVTVAKHILTMGDLAWRNEARALLREALKPWEEEVNTCTEASPEKDKIPHVCSPDPRTRLSPEHPCKG